MKKVLITAAMVFMAVAISVSAFAEEKKFGNNVGDFFAEVSASDMDDKAVAVKDLYSNGDVALVLISPTCSLCRKEISELQEAAGDKADKVIVVIAAAKNHADRFMKGYEAPFKVILDPDYEIMAAANFRVTPSTIILSKDGKVVKKFSQYRTGQATEVMNLL
jgi:peroxiredoxin